MLNMYACCCFCALCVAFLHNSLWLVLTWHKQHVALHLTLLFVCMYLLFFPPLSLLLSSFPSLSHDGGRLLMVTGTDTPHTHWEDMGTGWAWGGRTSLLTSHVSSSPLCFSHACLCHACTTCYIFACVYAFCTPGGATPRASRISAAAACCRFAFRSIPSSQLLHYNNYLALPLCMTRRRAAGAVACR